MSQKTRLWVIVTGLLCAIVVLYGVFAGFAPQLAEASRTHDLVDNTEQANETQQLQLTMLQTAEDNFDELEKDLEELQKAIPATAEWSQFLQELQDIGAATGARVSGIAVDPSILPEAAVADPADPAAAEDSAAAESDGATEETDAAAAATEDTTAAPVTGLVEIPMTISLAGDPGQISEFIRQLQTGDRLFVARSVDIRALEEGSTGTAIGSIFLMAQ